MSDSLTDTEAIIRLARDIKDDGIVLSLRDFISPLRKENTVYVLFEPDRPWLPGAIEYGTNLEDSQEDHPKMSIEVRVSHNMGYLRFNEYQVARNICFEDKLRLSKRVIAGSSLSDLRPGIVADTPCDYNKGRYLILMDDGSAQYATPDLVMPILGQTSQPWSDSQFVSWKQDNSYNMNNNRLFFCDYPRKDLIKPPRGYRLEVMKNGMIERATVLDIDCEVLTVRYRDNRQETIYRGSPRFQRRRKLVRRQLELLSGPDKFHPKLLAYIKIYQHATDEIVKRGVTYHQTAKKSTNRPSVAKIEFPTKSVKLLGPSVAEDLTIRIDHEESPEMKEHRCQPQCLDISGIKTEIDVVDLVDEFRHVSDIRVPLMLGWKRLRKWTQDRRSNREKITVYYEAPCGKNLNTSLMVRYYLSNTKSRLDIDYFTFEKEINLNRVAVDSVVAFYFNPNIASDKITGNPLENKYISVLNQHSLDKIEAEFTYSPLTQPHPTLEMMGFSMNTDFKTYCSCTDDCSDRINCPCHRWNEECAGIDARNRGSLDPKFNYSNKRLYDQVQTGIFECNSNCQCSSRCSNRVVQNGIRTRLQVQRTAKKGWGVFALDDIPAGTFLCTYSAQLLDDADQVGDCDIYLADLDYISVNQATKEDFSDGDDEGIDTEYGLKSEIDQILDRVSQDDNSQASQDTTSLTNSSPISQDDQDAKSPATSQDEIAPDDKSTIAQRYPKRSRCKTKPIVLDPEPKRQPTKKPELKIKDGKFKDIHELLGSRDFTLDSRFVGNLGRFINHSCDPSAFVQSVFIDTHDLRFPVVAFFTKRNIMSMEEITWNYNYQVGSLPGREITCHCESSKCNGRIL